MIIDLRELDKTKVAIAGGKAANLGELFKIDGVNVPAGFCITADSFLQDITQEVMARLDDTTPYAVRSSATMEDSPTASFAGQYDTYLNIVGKEQVIQHIKKVWESLSGERAIAYRNQNGIDHRSVRLAVIVQKMVPAQVSGIMFTADPVTSNRKVISIEATAGVGEALVSGMVNPDNRLLTDKQRQELEALGRKIESHFGVPQDIEWCHAGDKFYIVQSRPITTLYPVPERNDNENHAYLSVGHQQMMTDAMKPLGLTLWQTMSGAPMYKAGGRLFVDITGQLSSPAGRQWLLNGMEQHDPLIKDALDTLIERDFIKLSPADDQVQAKSYAPTEPLESDPTIVSDLIAKWEASLQELKQALESKSGPDVLDFIHQDLLQFRKSFHPLNMRVIMAVINASAWLNKNMNEWLGEKHVADTLSQSVPNNITSEMGLALLDVADALRVDPNANALEEFLKKYGMRCTGEIDITRPRWAEEPATIMPLIQSNIRNFKPGESRRRFERGKQEAFNKEKELLDRLRELPDGDQKAEATKRNIDVLRTFAGYREYPKYAIVSRLFAYKKALLRAAEGIIEKDDMYYLTFDELKETIRTRKVDREKINERKDEHRLFEKLTPPRVITSDGEIIRGKYKRGDIPANAIVGLAVSSGVIEGRARVILNMEDARLEEGDILVTSFTDPSWTPLFVSIKGLVTEVGGLMTHGAVIAREYGLPAVVGVENATMLIKDGHRIRVNGSEGYVEILRCEV
jgi:phosphoenolpyruvate synthase/pyruvate phosphate dikinase